MNILKINKKRVANNIQKIRKSQGLTMEQFGNLFDAHKSLVSKWEKAMSAPSRERLKEIAEYGGMTLPEILGISLEERVKEYYLNIMYGEYDLFYGFIENDEDFLNNVINYISGLNLSIENVTHELVRETILSLISQKQSNLSDLETYRINEFSRIISDQRKLLNELAIKLNIKEYDPNPEMLIQALSDLDSLKINIYSITERLETYLTKDIEDMINERIEKVKNEYDVDYDSYI
ncbi:TPA: helix-turn-helix domain-containing protein [Staphylococcus aureus]|uniref:helix-turn-helix domain-containing protein n=1 Tax=Staphylococcus aureus TaxID=1280 RepID=UPI001CBA8CE0|nr:helix-turn-helix transcriptional regulator [Staphylococcus aureus]MDI0185398.1 helix-turn-helix transcriptional regulator [Staphylococcus aureus]